MLLNLAQPAGLRKCDMGNGVACEEMIGEGSGHLQPAVGWPFARFAMWDGP